MSRRTGVLVAVGLLVCLVLAGIVSTYASSSPDGLEKVATDHGFAAQADTHQLAGSPLADYQTEGVADSRAAGGLAGVVGVGVTFVVGTGAAWLLGRRSRGASSAPATVGSRT